MNAMRANEPNWEAELKIRCAENAELKMCIDRLRDENDKLRCEMEIMRKDYDSMDSEFVRMRAQLDIVYLIFGKR